MAKIALIANGVSPDDPDALENILRSHGQEVDIFDVRAMHPTANGFAIEENGQLKSIDPRGYGAVARIIKGGVAGDTEKSWALQQFFEDHGAKPHIGIDAARKITDKILCKEVLAEKRVSVFPSISVSKDAVVEPSALQAQIETLGAPPFIVRKSLGSGKDSLAIASSLADTLQAIERYRHPAGNDPVRSGVLVHKPSAKLDPETIQTYGLTDVPEPEKRSFQFRVILVDGKPFGTNICYSEPDKFGLNPAQGATFRAVKDEQVPMDILALARKAAEAHGLKIAAVDIALDTDLKPRVMDMNASPDLSFKNARGEELKYRVAQSIETMAVDGPKPEDYRTVSSHTWDR